MKKKEKLIQYKKELTDVFWKISKDRKLVGRFLKDILTPAEFEALTLRWQIIKRLDKGETHREVADSLKLGISTVTRGSRELRDKKGGFNLVLDKLFRK